MGENTRFAVLIGVVVLVIASALWWISGHSTDEVIEITEPVIESPGEPAVVVGTQEERAPEPVSEESPALPTVENTPEIARPSPARPSRRASGAVSGNVVAGNAQVPPGIEVTLYQINWKRFEAPAEDGILESMVVGGGVRLEGLDPGDYTVAAFSMDRNDREPYSSMRITSAPVSIKEVGEEIEVNLSF